MVGTPGFFRMFFDTGVYCLLACLGRGPHKTNEALTVYFREIGGRRYAKRRVA